MTLERPEICRSIDCRALDSRVRRQILPLKPTAAWPWRRREEAQVSSFCLPRAVRRECGKATRAMGIYKGRMIALTRLDTSPFLWLTRTTPGPTFPFSRLVLHSIPLCPPSMYLRSSQSLATSRHGHPFHTRNSSSTSSYSQVIGLVCFNSMVSLNGPSLACGEPDCLASLVDI
jgi:hypothetical protein